MRRDRGRLSNDAQIGLAWSSREAWERLRAIADDREKLDDYFEECSAVRCKRSGTSPRSGGRFAKCPSMWMRT